MSDEQHVGRQLHRYRSRITALSCALSDLVRLKRLKRRIDGGTATTLDASLYETSKESIWTRAERALDGGGGDKTLTDREREALREAAAQALAGEYEGDPAVLRSAMEKLRDD